MVARRATWVCAGEREEKNISNQSSVSRIVRRLERGSVDMVTPETSCDSFLSSGSDDNCGCRNNDCECTNLPFINFLIAEDGAVLKFGANGSG